jgi:6-pyruvoyltetrahydropterin/6-carboxytetrahydropterin synthase
MSDNPSVESNPSGPSAPSAPPHQQIGDSVAGSFSRLVDVSAARVFGEPVRMGDRVVIPAASIDLSGGYGYGSGTDTSMEKGWSGGGGGGAGGHSRGRPVAIIEVGPDGVRVKPVLDFTRIKRLLRTVVDRLDHRMLLPTRSERVRVQQSGNEIVATYQDRRYVFPASDVVLLPIPNTTAEMLAQWIGGEIEAMLSPAELAQTTAMEVEVEESFGQSAVYRKQR